MTFTPGTEQLLQVFIVLAAVLLIPVAVGFLLVLFKLAFLLHSVQEFVRIATYELTPLIKELRLIVDHLEDLGHKAAVSVQEIREGIHHAGPLLRKGIDQVRAGTSALVSGISRSFERSS